MLTDQWLIVILIIITHLVLAYVWHNKTNNIEYYAINNIEHYADIAPYQLHWDIFKCLTMDCVKKKGLACYKWCSQWGEPGAAQNCRMSCFDNSDIQSDNLKWNTYFWNRNLPHFQGYSSLLDNSDWQ